MSDPGLHVALLGPVSVRRGDRVLGVGTRRQQVVLAVLALHRGRGVSTEQLIDALWDDDVPASGIATLHSLVSRLRSQIGRGAIETVSGTYRMVEGTVDVEWVERLVATDAPVADGDLDDTAVVLQRALTCFRGEPLAGLPGRFAAAERSRLDVLRRAVVERRIEVELRCGRPMQVLPEIVAAAAAEPHSEAVAALHLRALQHCGRRAEALAAYQAFRRRLVDELGVEPGEVLRAAHTAVLAGGAGPDPQRPVTDRPRHSPRMLPPPIRLFGRDAQVAALRGWLTPTDTGIPPLVHLTGAAGVGKTAVAVAATQTLTRDYPDGQLLADLRGSSNPVPAADIAATFLGALGADPGMASGSVALSRLRTLTADRRLLMVLDDAGDAETVRALLPGSTRSAVLVTSRFRLPELESTAALTLRPLDRDDAIELLCAVAGDGVDPDRAGDVAAGCDGLPLAVRVAGGRLRAGHDAADLAERLRNEREALSLLSTARSGVRPSLAASFAHLSPSAARALCLLAGLGPVAVSPAAAGALTGSGTTEPALDELVELNLVDVTAGGAIRLHDLVRAFAHDELDARAPGEFDTALDRLHTHLLSSTEHAVLALNPDPLLGPPVSAGGSFPSVRGAAGESGRDVRDASRCGGDRRAGG